MKINYHVDETIPQNYPLVYFYDPCQTEYSIQYIFDTNSTKNVEVLSEIRASNVLNEDLDIVYYNENVRILDQDEIPFAPIIEGANHFKLKISANRTPEPDESTTESETTEETTAISSEFTHVTPPATIAATPQGLINSPDELNIQIDGSNAYDKIFSLTSKNKILQRYFKNRVVSLACDEDRKNFALIAINSTIKISSDNICSVAIYGRKNTIEASGPIIFNIVADTNILSEKFDLSDPTQHPLWRVAGSNNVLKTSFTGKASSDYSFVFYGFDGNGTVFPRLGSKMSVKQIYEGDVVNMASFANVISTREFEQKHFLKLVVKKGAKPPMNSRTLLICTNVLGISSLILTFFIIICVFEVICKRSK